MSHSYKDGYLDAVQEIRDWCLEQAHKAEGAALRVKQDPLMPEFIVDRIDSESKVLRTVLKKLGEMRNSEGDCQHKTVEDGVCADCGFDVQGEEDWKEASQIADETYRECEAYISDSGDTGK